MPFDLEIAFESRIWSSQRFLMAHFIAQLRLADLSTINKLLGVSRVLLLILNSVLNASC